MLTVRVENWFFRGVWTISQLIYEAVMLVNFAILYQGAMTRDSRCDGVSVWMWGCWNIEQPRRQPPLPLRRHHSTLNWETMAHIEHFPCLPLEKLNWGNYELGETVPDSRKLWILNSGKFDSQAWENFCPWLWKTIHPWIWEALLLGHRNIPQCRLWKTLVLTLGITPLLALENTPS